MKRSTALKLIQLIFASQSRDPICGRLEAEILNECDPDPKPGTGACICVQSPESLRRQADLWNEPFETCKANMQLDHRCPLHGEKAQPALWGRHKEKVLSVEPHEWLSLGAEVKKS